MARVLGVMAEAIIEMSRFQKRSEGACCPLCMGIRDHANFANIFNTPRKFGHAGVGTMTSSPLPAISLNAIWSACMPPTVTKKRCGE
jgi:hypothetical protein